MTSTDNQFWSAANVRNLAAHEVGVRDHQTPNRSYFVLPIFLWGLIWGIRYHRPEPFLFRAMQNRGLTGLSFV